MQLLVLPSDFTRIPPVSCFMFPQPMDFTVSGSSDTGCDGTFVLRHKISADNSMISLTSLQDGVYFIIVNVNGKDHRQKLS